MAEPLTDPQIETVDDLLEHVITDDNDFGRLTFILTASPNKMDHYSALYRLRRRLGAFKTYAETLLQDKLPPEPTEEEQAGAMMQEYRDKFAVAKAQPDSLVSRAFRRAKTASTSSLVEAVTVANQQAGQEFIRSFVQFLETLSMENMQIMNSSLQRYAMVAKYGTYVKGAGVVLTVGFLGYEFYYSFRQWYKGEIDGVACTRNITSALTGTAAACGAAWAGGVVLGIPGAILGAILGSLLASQATEGIFHLVMGDDRSRALAKSYQVLGLQTTASAEEVRKAYLAQALQHHPDKGGSKEKFLEVNGAYEVIRAATLS